MAFLENWNVIIVPGVKINLTGIVWGHPKDYIPDGRRAWTSRIMSIDGKIAHTRHTPYVLGLPSSDYLDLLESKDLKYDEDNPIPWDALFSGDDEVNT